MLAWIICALFVVGIAIHYFVARRRHRRDLSEHLMADLKKCGMTLISSEYPGLFNIGPFPKFEVQVGRPQSHVAGVRGEYREYRIVSFRDAEGCVYELWALVEFELFAFRRVRWRAVQKESLPASVLPLLEN